MKIQSVCFTLSGRKWNKNRKTKYQITKFEQLVHLVAIRKRRMSLQNASACERPHTYYVNVAVMLEVLFEIGRASNRLGF